MNIKNLLVSGIILYLIDMIYISNISKKYGNMIQSIQGSPMKTKMVSAVICYLFLAFGVYYFIIKDSKKSLDAFFLGVVIYGVYNSTAHALLDKFDTKIAITDTIWGGILFYLTTEVYKKLNE